jgi:hypothetical protein
MQEKHSRSKAIEEYMKPYIDEIVGCSLGVLISLLLIFINDSSFKAGVIIMLLGCGVGIVIYKKLIKPYPIEVVGGLIGSFIPIVIIIEFHISYFSKALIELFGLAVGIILSKNIEFLIRVRKAYPIIRNDIKLLEKAEKHDPDIFLLEKKIISLQHSMMENHLERLFSAHAEMSLHYYEELLKFIIEVAQENNATKMSIRGTCLILPNQFNTDSPYANIWRRLKKKVDEAGSHFSCTYERILCDHKKENLIAAIKSHKENFERFCEWNLTTGFDLFIYRGEYDFLRSQRKLPFNDFLIYNDKIILGGDVTENEKTSPKKESEKFTITKSGLNYTRANNFLEFFNELKDDSQCKKINLRDKKNRHRETVAFLED